MSRCEDYPCCGHTDGLGCGWTPDYSNPHFLCDHEIGECEVQNALDDLFEELEDDYDPLDPDSYVMEDQWLDGSYED